MDEMLIPIVLFAGFFLMIIYLRHYSNKERMAMIEKGTAPGDLTFKNNSKWAIKVGLLAIGAGLGLLIGNLLDRALDMEDVAYFSMIAIFGGAGLVVAHYISKKEEENEL